MATESAIASGRNAAIASNGRAGDCAAGTTRGRYGCCTVQIALFRGADSFRNGAAMAKTVSDFLVQRLLSWGVRRVYGYPGDGINGVMGALNRAGGSIDFVQARHEEMAAFMACGHAKFTGEPGVCLATSGPGAIHVLNGLYDAKVDHQPVVAIVG